MDIDEQELKMYIWETETEKQLLLETLKEERKAFKRLKNGFNDSITRGLSYGYITHELIKAGVEYIKCYPSPEALEFTIPYTPTVAEAVKRLEPDNITENGKTIHFVYYPSTKKKVKYKYWRDVPDEVLARTLMYKEIVNFMKDPMATRFYALIALLMLQGYFKDPPHRLLMPIYKELLAKLLHCSIQTIRRHMKRINQLNQHELRKKILYRLKRHGITLKDLSNFEYPYARIFDGLLYYPLAPLFR